MTVSVAGVVDVTVGMGKSDVAKDQQGQKGQQEQQIGQKDLMKPHPELQYLQLVQRIMDEGERRPDRTGTGTLAIFAPGVLRFSLGSEFPLLTTKRVPLRVVFEELMWFVRGQTDADVLAARGVRIWEGNGSRAALDKLGLTERREGDLGPVYGFQWRHFGAAYSTADADYAGAGVDQLRSVVEKLLLAPTDRRIIISAWNPAAIPEMALPPCHLLAQFYVAMPQPGSPSGTRPRLSCQLYQRSCDMGLGVPFNIASYSMLTALLAHVCDLDLGEFVHCLGDAHVYVDHIDALRVQIQRTPRPFPKLVIKPVAGATSDAAGASMSPSPANESPQQRVDRALRELEAFEFDRIDLIGYDPHGRIEMKMSV